MPYRGPSTPTLVSRVWQLAADLLGEGLAELETPLAHNLTAHLDAAGRQHLFHHAQAQRKAEVEPHGVADALCGKAVAGVGGLGAGCHAGPLPVPACPAKPRPKLTVPGREIDQIDGWHDGGGSSHEPVSYSRSRLQATPPSASRLSPDPTTLKDDKSRDK